MVRRALLGVLLLAGGSVLVLAQRSGPATPSGVRLYVSDETGSTVAVVDAATGTVIDHLAVGKRPRGIKVTPDGKQLLVALSGSPIGGPGVDESKLPPPDRSADGIGIVDIATHKVVRIVKGGNDPESFDVSRDGNTAFISNEDAGELTVLDLVAGRVKKNIKVGAEPEGVTLRPDGAVVYVTSEGDGEVTAVDTTSLTVVGHMKTDARPRGIVFTKDGATAFVSCENGSSVMVINGRTHTVTGKVEIPKPQDPTLLPRPMGLVLSPDQRTLFVSLGRAKAVAVVDVATKKVTNVINDVGARPWGLNINPAGTKVYSANGPSHDISIIDVATGKVEKKVVVGEATAGPWGIAVATVK